MNWYIEVLKKYVVFRGRACRTEYWMFFLFNLVIGVVLGLIEKAFKSPGVLGGLYSFAMFIPGIAVGARRLHDTGRSGWWQLIALIPLIGVIVLIVFMVQDSQPNENQYGSNPKRAA